MTLEEIKKQYIHTPTNEMYELAEFIKNTFQDREYWSCRDIDMYTQEPLTDTNSWKLFSDVHYGRMRCVFPDSISKEDSILKEVDIFIDKIREKNPDFFKEFPISYIERKDSYVERGIYNSKFVLAGRSIESIRNTNYSLNTEYSIYTDGECDIVKSVNKEDIIDVSIKNYTLVILKTNIRSDDPAINEFPHIKLYV